MFDRMDLHKSFAFFRDRYADASDFTFYFVGRFEPDSIRPLVERYLGGLPSTRRQESWRDVGIRPPTGVIRKTVRRGTEPKARTQMVFSGPVQYDREQLFALRGLADVLEIRLRETLREDLGGTYGVGVRASASREPRPEYRFSIGFGAAPERLEELARETLAVIDSIKQRGPTEAELSKVREAQRRSREINRRENNAWLGQLMTFDRHGWDLRGIMAEPTVRLDAAMVQRAAQLYLNTGNYVQVSLVPENRP
ncbi:MAG: Probable zinc protease pqqL [uncultured Gemmatimonadetes bacterium]|uniref:Probable zinc protease pqqL n=1 Tax=uncultured Gemmatimonadota bacterium TaxID=203437 RepID=A0A6J4MWM4_9BACT|nr:MAG: Probable zinc protease pqqL [uncultured Gemmatimonadota bacterium]